MTIQANKMVYEQIAEYFLGLIRKRIYPPGSMLPSVREVALQEKVNPNTVMKAYNALMEQGYVYAVAKKGYFVKSDVEIRGEIEEALLSLKEKGYSLDEIQKTLNEMKGEGE